MDHRRLELGAVEAVRRQNGSATGALPIRLPFA